MNRQQLAAIAMKAQGTYTYSRSQPGELNGMWTAKPKYSSLHEWIGNNKPKPLYCEKCHKKKPLDAANISGKYKRDITDYKWLCTSCHMKEDGRVNNLMQYRKNAYRKNASRTWKKGKAFYAYQQTGLDWIDRKALKQMLHKQTGNVPISVITGNVPVSFILPSTYALPPSLPPSLPPPDCKQHGRAHWQRYGQRFWPIPAIGVMGSEIEPIIQDSLKQRRIVDFKVYKKK